MTDRGEFLSQIRANIARSGVHFTHVQADVCPQFGYSLGLHQAGCPECIIAGAIFYDLEARERIVDAAAKAIIRGDLAFDVTGDGRFFLRPVDTSWIDLLMLGAKDIYGGEAVAALQIVPGDEGWTIDIPDMSRPWSPNAEPIWKWLKEPWPYSVSSESTATTNMAAMRGEAVTEVGRWEVDQWELFAGSGPDTPTDLVRVVPLATLLAFDETLKPVVDLPVGSALWREGAGAPWNDWG